MAVYLDYAATTPTDSKVLTAMQPFFTECFGNPSSVYSFGRQTKQAVLKARGEIAELLGASSEEIFFTSGGSESDNWALLGIAAANAEKGHHVITSEIEHHAVLHTVDYMRSQGFDVTVLPVDRYGFVSADSLRNALRDDTVLVSIMMANNEVGTIQPVAELSEIAHARGVLFHTDAVQAAGHIPIDVHALGVDALSLSGHKLYGPKGIGALYVRKGVDIKPLVYGGGQERGLRGGTENVPGIVGLGAASVMALHEMDDENRRLASLRDEFISCAAEAIEGCHLNGASGEGRLPGNINLRFDGISSESLLIRLDIAGFAVSAGSACSAGAVEPSHVLTAMGLSEAEAKSSVRITIGRYTTKKELHDFFEELKKSVREIRLASKPENT
ncbi:cysteine desulfurase family protein [Schwartzia succinivorans]|jgi:cysteine desulfurase|uniref:cysteine desulfurase n=1 Tax=Schwartzia succinivorans DSM 10502 TaxID=1123243 RepID=A0A1M4URP2_9FIRM|nr:cysteine desulfurase family protein [Schwartzia succinivorans]SHE59402.1 cysteine desulfurase [Schwartzia succinivorans DSM 10502]